MKIEEIDSNFKVASFGDREVVYLDILKPPFSLEGFPWGDPAKGEFFRLPADFTDKDVNAGCLWNSHHWASGGAIRFRSDSPYITIRATLSAPCDMNHMTRTGSMGFDIYCGPAKKMYHVGSAQIDRDMKEVERMLVDRDQTDDTGMRDWQVNFPLYGGVQKVELGFAKGSAVEAPAPHKCGKIVFYGSSITQGGCASRPGNNYCSMLCRAVDAEQINMGFSGCGKGEIAVAKVIANLKGLGAFVMDYDHNAPSEDHLMKTHEKFFKAIRKKYPNLPVIMMTKPDSWNYKMKAGNARRRSIVKATYDKAIAAGDKHVYFISGDTLFGKYDREACTVDTCHPNDLGFYKMYRTVLPVLRKALKEI